LSADKPFAYVVRKYEKPAQCAGRCYVAEQIEEEQLARKLNDKLEMIGDDKSGLYLFDRDIMNVGQAGGRKH